jgi:hypothetical protein
MLRGFDNPQNVLSATKRPGGKLFSSGMGHSSFGSFRLHRCLMCAMYNAHGYKWRSSTSEKAQFVTALGIHALKSNAIDK